MTEQKPISKAELARHWGVSRPYLTLLAKPLADGGKAMPDFFDLGEADTWRAVNAPPRSRTMFAGEQSSPKNPVGFPEKNGGSSGTTTTERKRRATEAHAEVVPIDVEKFITREGDFDALMIRHATEVPQIAYGLLKLATSTGRAGEISAATKNWHEASDAAADVRERFLSLQEKSRTLLPLDEVMDVVGTELQAVRQLLTKLGELCANDANPSDPALARRVIDAAVDAHICARFALLSTRAQRELAAPAA